MWRCRMPSRRKVIAGNWKMNLTPTNAVAYVKSMLPEIKAAIDDQHRRLSDITGRRRNWFEVVLCVPFVSLVQVKELLDDDGQIKLGAQNMHYENDGAYTGEISASMLKEMGVEYVIIGHSERRAQFGETDIVVSKKVAQALKYGLKPILCIGESYEERMRGELKSVLSKQIQHALFSLKTVDFEDDKGLVIAYEPIWAIGTGVTATKEQAEEACKIVSDEVNEMYKKAKKLERSSSASECKIPILYGGSVNAGNAHELFKQNSIDGGLVGGASIPSDPAKPETSNFIKIVEAGAAALIYKAEKGLG